MHQRNINVILMDMNGAHSQSDSASIELGEVNQEVSNHTGNCLFDEEVALSLISEYSELETLVSDNSNKESLNANEGKTKMSHLTLHCLTTYYFNT